MVAGLYVCAGEDALARFHRILATPNIRAARGEMVGAVDRRLLQDLRGDTTIWTHEGLLRGDCPQLVEPWIWRRIRKQVRKAWSKFGNQARSMEVCGQMWKHFQCKSCRNKAPRQHLPIVCMSRYCPDCAKAKRKRSQGRSAELVARWSSTVRQLTLTIKTHPFSRLDNQRSQLSKAFQKLRRRKWWTDHVDGGISAAEATRGSKGSAWHAHLHLLLDGKYLPWPRLVDEWQSCTGCKCKSRPRGPDRGPGVLVRGPGGARRLQTIETIKLDEAVVGHIDPGPIWCCRTVWNQADEKRATFCTDPQCECEGAAGGPVGLNITAKTTPDAVRHASKYVCKELGGKETNLAPAVMAEFLRSTYGRRQFTTFGCHFDPELEAELDRICEGEIFDPDADEDTGPLKPCPCCNGTDFQFIAIEPGAPKAPP